MRLVSALLACGLLAACQVQGEPPSDGAPMEVTAEELFYCDLVEQAVTVDDCDRAARAQEQAAQGLAELAYPRRMTVGDPQRVRLTVGRVTPPPEPTQAPEQEAETLPAEAVDPHSGEASPDPVPTDPAEQTPTATVTYHPIVGRFTSARLEGTDFDIAPREAVTKEIPRGGEEVWDWEITPKRKGVLSFSVITNVQFKRTDGTYMSLAQKVTDYEVTVGVGLLNRIRVALDEAPGWIKAVTAILAALSGLAVAWFGLQRVLKNRGEDPKPPEESGDAAG